MGGLRPILLVVIVAASVGVGLLVLTPLTALVWILAAVAAGWVIRRSYLRADRDPIAASVAFPCAYLVFFLIGSLNLYDNPSSQRLDAPIPTSIWLYAGAGLAAYLLGERLGGRLALRRPASAAPREVSFGALVAGVVLCIATGVGALFAVASYYGLPILDVSIRSEVSGYLSYLNCLIWAGLMLSTAYWTPRLRSVVSRRVVFLAAGLVSVVVATLLAYRSPVVIALLGFLFLYTLAVRRISTPRLALAVVVVAILGSWFALERSSSVIGEDSVQRFYLHRTGATVSDAAMPFQNLYWNVFRESVSNFQELSEVIPEQQPYLLGRALGGSLISVLPGKQMTTREYVSLFVRGDTNTTLTPTVLGPLYMDFGIPGIVVGLAALGCVLGYLYARRRASPLNALLYSYWLALALASIHAGLSDPGYYLFLPGVFLALSAIAMLPTRSPGRLDDAELSGYSYGGRLDSPR
jgi:oligosaccharide repeat unit polymerase